MVRSHVPRVFSWTAPVWQADLDAFGELRNTTLLRLLQEAATRASTDAGFDSAYYDRTGLMWIIRRTRITLASPARYGDVLAIRTWIADFRRVRSQREYEVRVGDRLVARAASDWVFVDRSTGRPRRIPAEWETTFPPDRATEDVRIPFPETEPTARTTTLERRVELHELDALRHVNNSNYVSYLEQAAYDVAGAGGFDLDAQIRAGGRLRATSHDLEYLDAALYGETIAVTVWTVDETEHEIALHAHLHRGDPTRPLLHARSRYAWAGLDGTTSMPTAIRAVFSRP
jgi:acyl-CoA thioester hydrolase